ATRGAGPMAGLRQPLCGGLFQGDVRPSDHLPAKGAREPDRVRFVIEIDLEPHAGAVAAMAKAVRFDPPMVEPGPHLRHRVDQPAITDAHFDNVLHLTPPTIGLWKRGTINRNAV